MSIARAIPLLCSLISCTYLHAKDVVLKVEETDLKFPIVRMGTSLSVDPSGGSLLATTSDGTIAIWPVEKLSGQPEVLDGGHWQAWKPTFVPDGSGRMIVCCTRLNDKYHPVIELWDFKKKSLIAFRVLDQDFDVRVEPNNGRVLVNRISLEQGPDGSKLFLGELKLPTLEFVNERQLFVGSNFSVSGHDVVTIAEGGVRRLSTKTWKQGPVLTTPVMSSGERRIQEVALNRKKNWMSWSSHSVRPYKWPSGRISMRRYPAWGPEIIEIWNTKTEKSWKVHESKGPIYDLEFSPDNRYLVAVGGCAIDETVTPHGPSYAEIALYDLEKKKLVARTLLENHPFLYCCTFLPNGRDILALHQNNYEAAPEVIRIRIIETEKNPPAGKTESNFK